MHNTISSNSQVTATLCQYHLGHGTYEIGLWVNRPLDPLPEYIYITEVAGKRNLRAQYIRKALSLVPGLCSGNLAIHDKVGR